MAFSYIGRVLGLLTSASVLLPAWSNAKDPTLEHLIHVRPYIVNSTIAAGLLLTTSCTSSSLGPRYQLTLLLLATI